jgi:hypothetical protein
MAQEDRLTGGFDLDEDEEDNEELQRPGTCIDVDLEAPSKRHKKDDASIGTFPSAFRTKAKEDSSDDEMTAAPEDNMNSMPNSTSTLTDITVRYEDMMISFLRLLKDNPEFRQQALSAI